MEYDYEGASMAAQKKFSPDVAIETCIGLEEFIMEDCKFKKTAANPVGCEGGHTTAQHHMNVYERVIKQECGMEAHEAIRKAVDTAADVPVLVMTLLGIIMERTGCDRAAAVDRMAALCAMTKMHLEAR